MNANEVVIEEGDKARKVRLIAYVCASAYTSQTYRVKSPIVLDTEIDGLLEEIKTRQLLHINGWSKSEARGVWSLITSEWIVPYHSVVAFEIVNAADRGEK